MEERQRPVDVAKAARGRAEREEQSPLARIHRENDSIGLSLALACINSSQGPRGRPLYKISINWEAPPKGGRLEGEVASFTTATALSGLAGRGAGKESPWRRVATLWNSSVFFGFREQEIGSCGQQTKSPTGCVPIALFHLADALCYIQRGRSYPIEAA